MKLITMCVMLEQFFFVTGCEADEVRDKPPAVVTVAVEKRNLEIPVRHLENMEFDIVDRYKFKVSFLQFRNKEGQVVGNIVSVEVEVDVLRIIQGLVDVHEIDLMTHGVEEKFKICSIAKMSEIRIEFVAETV